MIRLVLLLLGTDFVRLRWRWLAFLAITWIIVGLAIFVDALDGVIFFPLHVFTAVLLIEGIVALGVSFGGLEDARRNRLRRLKGVLFVVTAVLLADPYPDGDFILSMLLGVIFLVGGLLRISAAYVVRFAGWRAARIAGALELAFSLLIFSPWPISYRATVPAAIGVGLALSGWALLRFAQRMRNLPSYASVASLTGRTAAIETQPLAWPAPRASAPPSNPLTVRVWTASGSLETHGTERPIVDRYIAAVDAKGVISTGHAALEALPDIYISHYPAVELDRSPDQFQHTLLASRKNNVPGKFQDSYAIESAGWCACTETVEFADYDLERLRSFWTSYSADTTYNLTNRNCSSTVVIALETALEGRIGQKNRSLWIFLRLLHSPELWLASQLYRRADTMAWTPGLVLDYSRALRSVIDPPATSWFLLARTAWRRYRLHKQPAASP
jgi:uncharacterized membrane protein HdeD (DUF308 family)